jgi:hypothetical protein
MSLLVIDGFDSYGTTTNTSPSPTGVLARKYTVQSESSIKVQAGRLSGRSIQLAYLTNIQSSRLTTNPTFIFGGAFKLSAAVTVDLVIFLDGQSTQGQGMKVTYLRGGELQVLRGSTAIATTTGLRLHPNRWYYLEFKVYCHDTLGTYELRVGNVNVLSATNVDTRVFTASGSDYHTSFRLPGANNQTVQWDDLYVCDGAGTVNNDFLGPLLVNTLRPDAIGDSSQWTPNAGSNYQCVDEDQCDDDTSYVEEGTSAEKDLYGYSNLSSVTGGIKGVQVTTDCKYVTADGTLVTLVKSGSTESPDAGQAVGSTTYTSKRRVIEQDPATLAAWDVSGVNAAQFGVKLA